VVGLKRLDRRLRALPEHSVDVAGLVTERLELELKCTNSVPTIPECHHDVIVAETAPDGKRDVMRSARVGCGTSRNPARGDRRRQAAMGGGENQRRSRAA